MTDGDYREPDLTMEEWHALPAMHKTQEWKTRDTWAGLGERSATAGCMEAEEASPTPFRELKRGAMRVGRPAKLKLGRNSWLEKGVECKEYIEAQAAETNNFTRTR